MLQPKPNSSCTQQQKDGEHSKERLASGKKAPRFAAAQVLCSLVATTVTDVKQGLRRQVSTPVQR
jgi:hypothetical protein